jgi:hypothetical protein
LAYSIRRLARMTDTSKSVVRLDRDEPSSPGFCGRRDRRETQAFDHRVGTGKLLIEARAEVKAQGLKWEAWCAGNIKRHQGDIRKLMRLASAENPCHFYYVPVKLPSPLTAGCGPWRIRPHCPSKRTSLLAAQSGRCAP